jgi:ribosomal protein S17
MQRENEKSNKRLVARLQMEKGKTITRTIKIQEENKMLHDKLNQYVEKETDKLVHISQLRRNTNKDN